MAQSPLRLALLLIPLVFACFGLLPTAQAVDPAPDGGYGPPAYGTGNTAEGEDALLNLTSGGNFNTATGYRTLYNNTTGNFNTAIGAGALFYNTADQNTAIGAGALLSNTTGSFNVATGESALFFNTTGTLNVATGDSALLNNTIGSDNTANGSAALGFNTTGNGNTANGNDALFKNTTGDENTANGFFALWNNTTGLRNTAIGTKALFGNTIGSFNIAVGRSAGALLTTGDNNIDIGNFGIAGDSATIRIGAAQTKTFIAGIRGVTTGIANAIPVLVDTAGQLGTAGSSRRFKSEIKPMNNASEAVLGLRPVTFHYKSDTTDTPQFGLIAEEVAAVNPDLVVRDKDGEIYTVRYDAVNAMLLNEFLKEHRKVQELSSTVETKLATIVDLKSTVAQQQKGIEALTARFEEQDKKIQKVSAQLEATKPAPQVVNNP
jgi:trimeric autotransporter adhesin